jgi:hypothetical protein
MAATDVEPTRLAKAKEKAEHIIDSLKHRDEMAIVTAGVQPKVVCGLTGHQRTLREALDGIPETDGPTRVTHAAALARRLVAGHRRGQLVVLSDGCFQDADKLAASGDVVWMPVGRRSGNVGITRFQVRRSLLDPIGYQILIEVVNFSDQPLDLRLDLELDSQIVDVIPIELEAEGSWSQVLEKTSAQGGRLRAALDRPDSLSSDNVAWAILPRRQRQPVILVSQGNVFLERVFEANSLVDLTVTAEPPAETPADRVVVFHRKVPNPVPAGNVLVIQPANSTDLWDLGEDLENPIVAKQNKDSPLMAHVRLDNVLMSEACQLKVTGKADVLAQTATDNPLYFAVEQPGRKLLVLTVNLDRGDLPLRTAFPILVANALGWFAGTKGELRESLSTGAVADITLPESMRSSNSQKPAPPARLVLRSPEGKSSPIGGGGKKVTVGPMARCGVWQIVQEAGQTESEPEPVEVACNLASREESDLRTSEPLKEEQAAWVAGFGIRPIWFYLLALAWLLTGVEWFLYQRRWIS